MATANDARKAHKLLDDISNGYPASVEEVNHLRNFLPERPKDVTLDVLLTRVHAAWLSANPSDWGFDTPAEHHDWLFDLRNDLVRIIEDQDSPATIPALPAGMRLAEHEEWGRVVVSPSGDSDGDHLIFYIHSDYEYGAGFRYENPSDLSFIDTEPAMPAHPEFLETEADYENAPEGTIVAKDSSGSVCVKTCLWPDMMVPTVKRRILRWGWGNE